MFSILVFLFLAINSGVIIEADDGYRQMQRIIKYYDSLCKIFNADSTPKDKLWMGMFLIKSKTHLDDTVLFEHFR